MGEIQQSCNFGYSRNKFSLQYEPNRFAKGILNFASVLQKITRSVFKADAYLK